MCLCLVERLTWCFTFWLRSYISFMSSPTTGFDCNIHIMEMHATLYLDIKKRTYIHSYIQQSIVTKSLPDAYNTLTDNAVRWISGCFPWPPPTSDVALRVLVETKRNKTYIIPVCILYTVYHWLCILHTNSIVCALTFRSYFIGCFSSSCTRNAGGLFTHISCTHPSDNESSSSITPKMSIYWPVNLVCAFQKVWWFDETLLLTTNIRESNWCCRNRGMNAHNTGAVLT